MGIGSDNRAFGYLIGERVFVLLAGQLDGFTARLEAFDHPWLRLQHDDGRIACYPYQQIGLITVPEHAVSITAASGRERAAHGR